MLLQKIITHKKQNMLSIYCTSGYPQLNSLPTILQSLESAGVDFVEVGIPYSDPIADGPTIQSSNSIALENGITIDLIFEQVIASNTSIPKVMMSYFNPVLQYGVERFLQACQEANISGIILPDLPVELYQAKYKTLFEQYQISKIFLISPQTSPARLVLIDKLSTSFIYAVSSASTTGKGNGLSGSEYLKGLKNLNLSSPIFVGFNIATAVDLALVHQHAAGGIIGSAFIKHITGRDEELPAACKEFVESVL